MRHVLRSFAVPGILFGIFSSASAQGPAVAVEKGRLEVGRPVEGKLAGGEAHAYRIALKTGEFVHVVVDQQGIDVAVALSDPANKKLAEVDSPNFSFGPEPLSAIAKATGDYRVEVTASTPSAPAAQYEIRIEVLRPATHSDQKRAEAQGAFNDAETLRGQFKADAFKAAVPLYEKAAALWHEVGDSAGEARTLYFLADTKGQLGAVREGLEAFQKVLALQPGLHDPGFEAATLFFMGFARKNLGELKEGLADMGRAAAMQRKIGDTVAEGVTLGGLGQAQLLVGDHRGALASFLRSFEIMRSIGERRSQAISLNNIAIVYEEVDELDKALDFYTQALAILRAVGDRRNEAITLNNVGLIYASKQDWQKAREYHTLALALRRETGDRRGEAYSLNNLAVAQMKLGDRTGALDDFNKALELRRSTGDRYGEATTLYNLGELHLAAKEPARALELFESALAVRRSMLEPRGEAEALLGMARALRDRGDLEGAHRRCEEALDLTDSLRMRVASPDSRASYLGKVRPYYDMEIDLLMSLNSRTPGGGLDALAFQVSERGRARSLLDLLAESRVDIRQGVDAALLERERSLRKRLGSKVEAQSRLLGGKHTDEEAAAAAKEVQTLLSELQQVESEVRTVSPRFAALTQPRPLAAREVQDLLDENTLVLEYFLGEEHSYLWAIGRHALSSFVLPKRSEIEAAARAAYDEFSKASANVATAPMRPAAARLSELVLRPAADLLRKSRLVVVADGALHFVPFAALPWPASGALLAGYEVVSLPSASTLALLRREVEGRAHAPKTMAVFADPVFERDDSRVQLPRASRPEAPTPSALGAPLARSVRDVGLGDGSTRIARLPFTRREARAILDLTPADTRKEALDFDASKAAATSEDLARYRFVHFATHGFVDTVHPELSGLVLSLVDPEGREQDGFLPATDVFNLRLSADLVVLSACRTALGKEIRSEGLVGLTRAFMYAGAPRVVASLWRVDDAATAELMKRFYEGMLGPGKLRPAAALREAQLAVAKQKRWRDPYYWAAFVLQGEWN